ncbi:MAG: Ig-like domain-containing protein, partial [Bacteroidales bacterium]|nr:Ig-like domain-containing protein [Bacteroidales bacterium]
MAAIVFASCDKDENGNKVDRVSVEFKLTATPSSQKISDNGTAAFTFTLSHNNSPAKYTANVKFTAVNGSVSPASATTDENGNVTVTFTTTDPQGFTGGEVKAEIIYVKGDKDFLRQGGNIASATAKVLPLNGEEPGGGDVISDEGLKTANRLNDNEFVVDGRKLRIGEWQNDEMFYGVKSNQEGTERVLYIYFFKEHPTNNSVAGGDIHVPAELLGQEIDLLANGNERLWLYLWSLQDPNQAHGEDNPSIEFNTDRDKANFEKATVKFTQDPQTGACSALVYMKTKDGKEAYGKMKAIASDPWQVQ